MKIVLDKKTFDLLVKLKKFDLNFIRRNINKIVWKKTN